MLLLLQKHALQSLQLSLHKVLLRSQWLRRCHLQHMQLTLPQQQMCSQQQQLKQQQQYQQMLLLLLTPSRIQHRDCWPLVRRAYQQQLRRLLPWILQFRMHHYRQQQRQQQWQQQQQGQKVLALQV
jgi:hypothetical protein